MRVTGSQCEVSDSKRVVAVFMPYSGEHRCAKCVFQTSDFCKRAPCTADERKDGRQGFFRAANKSTSEFAIADAFKGLLR